jgi:hypothetical protein
MAAERVEGHFGTARKPHVHPGAPRAGGGIALHPPVAPAPPNKTDRDTGIDEKRDATREADLPGMRMPA